MTQLIDYLIEQRGIGSDFIDAWGQPATIAPRNQQRILNAMGYHVENETDLLEQVEAEAVHYWLQPLSPVKVVRVGDKIQILLRTSIEYATKPHSLKLVLESNEVIVHKFVPVETQLIASQDIDGLEWQEYLVDFPACKTMGYHQLHLIQNRKVIARSSLIIAPKTCYIPTSIKKGKKIWGLSVQLYCLRSKRNWGIGDFTDLINLAQSAAQLGADFIGLNPIHSLYPGNPEACSPYGPSSRRWLNFLYIDVASIPCFDDPSVQDWFNSPEVQHQLQTLCEQEYVDYKGVSEVKLKALSLVFDIFKKQLLSKKGKYKDAFNAFVKEGGKSLKTLATFDALQTSLQEDGQEAWGWPVFPEQMRSADSPDVADFAKKNKKRVEFYLFLQWQAAVQFKKASKAAKKAGMEIGIYRDLAVGVSEGGAEIWGNKSLYCTDVSAGAPPDVLGPLGQKWGLPPMDPAQLEAQQYQPIIDLFASNMKNSGALRIDHVMALLRLWWVHNNDDASQGAYVNYPVDDLLAILALESQRNKSLVIGEDLGTVPESIRDKLQQNGIYSYRLFFFEQAEDGGFYSPEHYPEQSMATLTTHDMPTLSGFWHCDDLALGKEMGLYPDQEVLKQLYVTRHENKQHILDTLHGHHSVDNTIGRDVNYVGMSTALNYGMQIHMASGSSALLSLQLEDWLEMDKPVNIPGTFDEYPNWRRKLSHNLEDIFGKPEIQALAAALSHRRQQASQ